MEKTVQNWRHLNLNLIFLGADAPTVGVPQNMSPRLTGQVSLWRDPDIGTGTPRSERPFLVRLSQRRSCRRPSISGIRRLFSKTRDILSMPARERSVARRLQGGNPQTCVRPPCTHPQVVSPAGRLLPRMKVDLLQRTPAHNSISHCHNTS